MIYPNGVKYHNNIKGQYKAKWDRGKMISGDYHFEDNLKYEFNDWKYCTGADRRFHQEIKGGIKPAGATQMSKEDNQPYDIPEGTYGSTVLILVDRCRRGLLRTHKINHL